EVRVLSGALGKPRNCGAFSSSGYTLCVCPTVDVPGWAATTPNIRTTYLEAPLRGGELRGGLTAQERGAQEGECEEHDDPDRRAGRGDRLPDEDEGHDRRDDPERPVGPFAQE